MGMPKFFLVAFQNVILVTFLTLTVGSLQAQLAENLAPKAVRRITTKNAETDPRQVYPVGCLAFSPDNKVLSFSARDLRMIDVASGKEIQRLDRWVRWPVQMAFCKKGDLLVFIDKSKTVLTWKWQTAEEPKEFYEHTQKSLFSLAVTEDGLSIAVGDGRKDRVYLWHGAEEKVTLAARCYPLSFCLGDKALLTGGAVGGPNVLDKGDRSDVATLFDVASGKELRPINDKEYFNATDADVLIPYASVPTSDGQSLLLHAGKTVRFWNLADGKLQREWTLDKDRHVDLDFLQNHRLTLTRDAKLLAIASDEGAIRLYDAETGKNLHRLKGKQGRHFSALAFSPNGHLLASGGWDGSIVIWDLRPE